MLFLDADCYPCRNPEFLFELEDYRARGAIFWPDALFRDPRLKWAAYGVADPKRPGSVESGQFVLHKRLSWRPLNLAWFYNDHSDYYYRYCYGDKHTFEVAWARCDQPFVMWGSLARWVEVAYVQVGPDGQPLFIHRCSDKFRLKAEPYSTPQVRSGQTFVPELPLEAECWNWLSDLSRQLGGAARRARNAPSPERVVRVGLPGHYNCSLIEYRGRLLLASRQGDVGASLHLSELGPDFQPQSTRQLAAPPFFGFVGLEDPRLFLFRGLLHCAFTGLEAGPVLRTHQAVCRLDAEGIEEVWLPEYGARAFWEKNWQFFEHEGELYSVYAVRPHLVLRHHGGRVEEAARTAAPLPWSNGDLRGGAPPVRVGEEFYHFFHTRQESGGRMEYAAAVYTFAARPPFEVRRAAAAPILVPDEYDRPAHRTSSVVFPCGAILRSGKWIISYGYHDQECRLAVFDAGEIEDRLRPL